MVEGENCLKRGKGKLTIDINRYTFYSYYVKNRVGKKIDRKTYNKFFAELFDTYSKAIVNENLELKLSNVGKVRMKSIKVYPIDKDGNLSKSLRIDWKTTKEYWKQKYPGLTLDELKNIPNKPLIRFESEEGCKFHWDKITIPLKGKGYYNFKPSRIYSRMAAPIMNDPNRKVFYYG